jgi:ATP-dependent Lon protease
VKDEGLVAALIAAKASHHPYIGVFLPVPDEDGETTELASVTDVEQVHKVGTLAQITRLTQTPNGVQVLLLGGRRVTLDRVVQAEPVMLAKMGEAQDENPEDSDGVSLAKAYSMEVMQTIKEILKLNPFFKEQMQMILERTEIHESGKLADFGAALTTADAQSLQGVLATLNVTERIEKTLLLLKKELEVSKLQSEISRQVEDKMSANQRRYMLMEQLKHIKKELGLEKDDKEALVAKFQVFYAPSR